ncbi:MAG TPA: phosphate ABC transporter substrate-binding protein [Anaerohalosphaeraceae bacterium]|nr:phosphate ABC transporter substrate-binding protein [Anaerohalosphaeraceae bacterium]HOL87938.1 phosphate ABC transporter substrate-binding protein [Anaerohalosphaeraceae bacterium]HPP55437.1 phosphate ABC transporter substrate-binding protein [Anaerohalosphaeraceae bacterium]
MMVRHGKTVLFFIGLTLWAAQPVLAAEGKTLQIDGSTTVGPLGDAFAEVFKELHPDVSITVKKTGSGDGAAALIDGRCDIAMMSRFMKDKEFQQAVEKGVFPVAHVIAMDGVCVVVHPSNPVTELRTEQIRDIYMGKITNWKELGGPDMPIVPVSRDTSSGTYESFHSMVMHNEKMAANVEYVNSNPQAHARVRSTPGAIGYVGIGFLDRYVKALKVDGVMPTRSTIAKGIYPVSRPLFLFTNGYPKLGSIIHAFCTFYLTEKGQEIIEAKGFVPVTEY